MSSRTTLRSGARAILSLTAALGLWAPSHPATAQNAMVPAAVPPAADQIYLDGRSAFEQGRDAEAADLLVQAVRMDWHCQAVLRDARFQARLPSQPCAQVPGLVPPDPKDDPGPEALYRLGLMRRAAARDQKTAEVLVRREGEYFFRRLVRDYKSSAWADNAALLRVEDGFCVVDEGYPECVVREITGYERWLDDYGASELKAGVLQKVAGLYLELAKRYDEAGPWNAPVKAELCRGRALELARLIPAAFPGTLEAQWGLTTAREIQDSGKAYSMVPRSVLEQ